MPAEAELEALAASLVYSLFGAALLGAADAGENSLILMALLMSMNYTVAY